MGRKSKAETEMEKKEKQCIERAKYLIKVDHPIIIMVAVSKGYDAEEVPKLKKLESFKRHIVNYLMEPNE